MTDWALEKRLAEIRRDAAEAEMVLLGSLFHGVFTGLLITAIVMVVFGLAIAFAGLPPR